VEEYETSSEELKSSNEELLSINEELQSSNEELETSKEELQSLNEELQTVNHEMTAKVDELDRANSDLNNLIESTQIATLFLDRNLVIRNFTPMITKIFRLIRTDIGRPIQDIVHTIKNVTLDKDMREVLRTDKPVEREVTLSQSSDSYSMRILPYRDAEGKTRGVVLTFVDITSAKASERQRGMLVEELNHRVKNILAVAMSIASQMLRNFNSVEEFRNAYFGRLQALARANELLSQRDWAGAKLRDVIELELNPYENKKSPISLDGPDVLLLPRAALSLGLVFHELATNAAKHGALAQPGMKLKVTWALEHASEQRLTIQWDETGGRQIKAPETTSFGMNLIRRALTRELSAKVDVEFKKDGLRCAIQIPAASILAETPDGRHEITRSDTAGPPR
jgi:two-component system, chemotaxis family, CheB/CheR fusion protein